MPELVEVIHIYNDKTIATDHSRFQKLCQDKFGKQHDNELECITKEVRAESTKSRTNIFLRLKQLWAPFDARIRLAGVILDDGGIATTARDQL